MSCSPHESGGVIKHWDANTGDCLHTITETDNMTYCLDFNKRGTTFAAAGSDRKIRVYDEFAKVCYKTKEGSSTDNIDTSDYVRGHSQNIYCLKFHNVQNDIMLSAGWDNCVYVWDLRASDSPVKTIYGPHIIGDALDFGMHGREILTGSHRPDDSLQCCDFATGKLVTTIPWRSPGEPLIGEQLLTLAACFGSRSSQQGEATIGCCGSGYNVVKIISREDSECIAMWESIFPLFSMDFSHDNSLVVVGDADGNLTALDYGKFR